MTETSIWCTRRREESDHGAQWQNKNTKLRKKHFNTLCLPRIGNVTFDRIEWSDFFIECKASTGRLAIWMKCGQMRMESRFHGCWFAQPFFVWFELIACACSAGQTNDDDDRIARWQSKKKWNDARASSKNTNSFNRSMVPFNLIRSACGPYSSAMKISFSLVPSLSILFLSILWPIRVDTLRLFQR